MTAATRTDRRSFRFALAGALAAVLVAGCSATGSSTARLDRTASQAETALARGNVDRAISLGEQAVAADPRNVGYRATLAHAYLRAGRFASASATFNDAMELGDNSARTALGLALAEIGAGRSGAAVTILDDWRDTIPASDLGLALALAGETSRGVAVLGEAVRDGDITPKTRQNLAYAYALDGRWREARIVMSQDVPVEMVGDRISEWAQLASPEDFQKRVAALLGAPVRSDPGQPQRLALSNTPSAEQLAAEAGALRPEPQVAEAVADGELPAVDGPAEPQVALAALTPADEPSAPMAEGDNLAVPPMVPVEVAANGVQYVSMPIVQAVPARADFAPPAASARTVRQAPAVAAARPAANGGTHLVQLGSFSSPQGARRAWGILAARNPQLRNYRMVITPAVVNGRNFWRVAAAGFNANGAQGMCSTVRSRGGACFAYAATRSANPAHPAPTRNASGPQNARRR